MPDHAQRPTAAIFTVTLNYLRLKLHSPLFPYKVIKSRASRHAKPCGFAVNFLHWLAPVVKFTQSVVRRLFRRGW
jgi:hypothetical protein